MHLNLLPRRTLCRYPLYLIHFITHIAIFRTMSWFFARYHCIYRSVKDAAGNNSASQLASDFATMMSSYLTGLQRFYPVTDEIIVLFTSMFTCEIGEYLGPWPLIQIGKRTHFLAGRVLLRQSSQKQLGLRHLIW